MASFDMRYDEEDDVLEVTFAVFDERFSRTMPLNDHIFLFTDLGFGAVWGLTFYSFSRLLAVNETEFSALKELPFEDVEACLGLLSQPPASHFFELNDPNNLIARVRAPHLEALVVEPEP